MIQAFIVYFVLLIIMLLLALRGKFVFSQEPYNIKNNKKYFRISVISIFIFSLVIGLRHYVGGDYVSYVDDFNDLKLTMSYENVRYELGYYLLMFILKLFKLDYPFLFITVTFLQITFIYKWASNYKYSLPWIVFFYFTTLYLFESMNIMRQATAFSILFYSTIYIQKSYKIKFIIMVLLASSFHRSAIFFLPFYFFVNKEWIKNKYAQISLIILAFIFSKTLFNVFFQKIGFFAEMLNYQGYAKPTDDLFLEKNQNSMGFGLYFIVTIDTLLLFYSDKLKKVFRKESYIIYHNMFFLGALLSAAFADTNSIALGRFMFYFVSFRFVVLSFLCYYLFRIDRNKINKLIGIFVIIAYLFWFINAISKGAAWCAPFQFVFQDFAPNSLYFNK